MTDYEFTKLNQRVAWLERKMSELLSAIAFCLAVLIGWQVAKSTIGEEHWWGWWWIVFGVTTFVVFGVEHQSFDAAPAKSLPPAGRAPGST